MPYPERRAQKLQEYFDGGFHEILRQCERESLEIIARLDRDLYAQWIDGSIAEIGVLHGASFIAMQHLTEPGTKSLAIDVFDLPSYVLDPTGNGGGRASMASFKAALEKWGRPRDVITIEIDSLFFIPPVPGLLPIKIFSIDGNHTKEHTLADLNTAVSMTCPGGIVVVDDYNEDQRLWPLVKEAADEYLARPDCRLTRIDVGHNKLYLRRT